MTRGKYSAKAANRLAQLDNELLQEKSAEIEALKERLAESEKRAQLERVERNALVLSRANELSQELIRAAREEAAKTKQEADIARREAADWLVDYVRKISDVNPDVKLFPPDFHDFIRRLVGSDHLAEYNTAALASVPGFAKRANRRASLKANAADWARPHWARGIARRGYAESDQ